ncbi:MAG: hypothetical protein Q4C53_05580 [Clostridia bacterium]|nr:hypothetical protein [Clostridia bacterium]
MTTERVENAMQDAAVCAVLRGEDAGTVRPEGGEGGTEPRRSRTEIGDDGACAGGKDGNTAMGARRAEGANGKNGAGESGTEGENGMDRAPGADRYNGAEVADGKNGADASDASGADAVNGAQAADGKKGADARDDSVADQGNGAQAADAEPTEEEIAKWERYFTRYPDAMEHGVPEAVAEAAARGEDPTLAALEAENARLRAETASLRGKIAAQRRSPGSLSGNAGTPRDPVLEVLLGTE